ncbi:transposase [Streptomyces pratens]|uniref:Transposase n=1 Tax=Streptomyces pratens TaxID=887456 RepID=A0ABW1M1W0_9ACTN
MADRHRAPWVSAVPREPLTQRFPDGRRRRMTSGMERLPTTEAAVTALRAFADVYGREIEVTHDIGADQTSRRTAAGVGVTTDPDATAHDVDRLWRIFLRRFDIEHTFRFFKQALGLTRPRLRNPAQADRWVWLILAAYTRLRLARSLTEDLRRPWEKPLTPDRLTPGRVRRGYPRIRRTPGTPAGTPKATHPGPGRPKGRTSTPAPRHPIGKEQHKVDKLRCGGAQEEA